MIKKLNNKIFFVLMISLSTVILGIIIISAIGNYRNTVDTATMIMERFSTGEKKKELNEKIDLDLEIEGMYSILVEDNKVISNFDISVNKEIEDYALKISNTKKESGIIGKYIYKVRNLKENSKYIILMENENAILHIKVILIFSVIVSILSLIIIYILSKKVSKIIVQPVEETFERQKQFISDASHELKTPLAVIEANADVLENEIGNNKWIKYIQNEIQSMNKLINELLLLAKLENIDNLKEYKQFDLSKEIEIIFSMFESIAYEKSIKLNTRIQPNINMYGDKEDIKHIVSTLIDNAIKHTEPEKDVTIELFKEKNEIIIQVKNTGEQIPEEEREKIFERFYRVDKSRNRNEKRYGLGLAIAKSITLKYKGKIEVFCVDGVTNFKVTIPV